MVAQEAKLTVTWNLDPVPGWNHTPADLVRLLQSILDERIPHYDPQVEVAE